jgi:hypothetical protein
MLRSTVKASVGYTTCFRMCTPHLACLATKEEKEPACTNVSVYTGAVPRHSVVQFAHTYIYACVCVI